MDRVQQEHHWGCQVAVLAMILGVSYQEALGFYPCEPDSCKGFSPFVLETILAEQGHAWARKCKIRTGFNNEVRKVWPPVPFAKLHWCQVITSSGGAHAIIMLEDGTVLDPWTDQRKSLNHPDYTQVVFVAAITKF